MYRFHIGTAEDQEETQSLPRVQTMFTTRIMSTCDPRVDKRIYGASNPHWDSLQLKSERIISRSVANPSYGFIITSNMKRLIQSYAFYTLVIESSVTSNHLKLSKRIRDTIF